MNEYPSLEQVQEITGDQDIRMVPITRTIPSTWQATQLYGILKNISQNVFILESCEDKEGLGRYSFLGFDPTLELVAKDHHLTIKSGMTVELEGEAPHTYIRQIMEEHKSPKLKGLPPFTGGLVGYFSYDFIKYSVEKLNLDANDEENFNDVDLMLFDKIIALDHLQETCILIANMKVDHLTTNYNKAVHQLDQMEELLLHGNMVKEKIGKLQSPLTPSFQKEEFCQMVKRAKEYIHEGDIFQVVLSNRLSAKYEGSLIQVYEKLRERNPSPYLFYFSSNDIEMAGASPETLVKVQDQKVMTYPLAGTRPRGKTPEEDLQLEKELLGDEKERAEHNMLVDLGRNDIGKISTFGSVAVEEYMKILRFSHVMHIGSTVTGSMAKEYDALDAVDAILPAGTLSGAPKVRALEIINELENEKRGIYGGAVGYIDFSGNVDVCIAIRLAFAKNGKIFVRSGAGIVMDSVPENEYQECINKAKSVVSVLEEM